MTIKKGYAQYYYTVIKDVKTYFVKMLITRKLEMRDTIPSKNICHNF